MKAARGVKMNNNIGREATRIAIPGFKRDQSGRDWKIRPYPAQNARVF
jgi:hypothetical protein